VLLCLCATAAAANKKPPLHPINLNTASSTELQEVPRIGPVTADKILKMRKSYGPFKSVDDLCAIKGIALKRLREDAEVSYRDPAESERTVSATRKNSPPTKSNSQPSSDSSPEQQPR
jgi:competence ComEA-like helix-hairpin-helix protein